MYNDKIVKFNACAVCAKCISMCLLLHVHDTRVGMLIWKIYLEKCYFYCLKIKIFFKFLCFRNIYIKNILRSIHLFPSFKSFTFIKIVELQIAWMLMVKREACVPATLKLYKIVSRNNNLIKRYSFSISL